MSGLDGAAWVNKLSKSSTGETKLEPPDRVTVII